MKSLLCCVFWPAWVWTFKPESKWIFASYALGISKRDNLRMRRLIESDWYRKRWGNVFEPLKDNWGAIKFVNDQSGMRLCSSTGGTVTGEHGDVQVVDDPIKPMDVTGTSAITKTVLNSCLEWWNETMSSRLVDFEKSARVIIMQRLHVHDLAGAVLKNKGYVHLRLPMHYEPKEKCKTSIGFSDPRKEEGELLWPNRFSKKAVAQLKNELGPRGFAAQLQQRPTPLSGSLFEKQYVQFWQEKPKLSTVISSWDCSFKETGNSFVVGQVWGAEAGNTNFYLLDQIRKRMSFSETLAAIRDLYFRWPECYNHLIEEKANGSAIIDVLKREINGIKPVLPVGGKEARANSVESLWSTKKIFLPDPQRQPWVNDFIQELTEFPSSLHDDQVDAMTQGLIWLRERSQRWLIFEKSMANTGNIAQWLY
jgi:predicted phage terminase large subunit-like protein